MVDITYEVDHIVAGHHLPCIDPVRQGSSQSPDGLADSESFSRIVVVPALI